MTDDLTAWILQYNSGRVWFNKLVSQVTKCIYLKRFKIYCDSIGKNPDELIDLKIDGQKSIGTTREYQAENLLETFLSTSSLTSSMKVAVKTAVMSFYAKNRRRLEPDVAENIDVPESKKRCPTINDLLELENHMPMLRDKALLWFLSSAPFRIGTIPKLKWNDLRPTDDKDVPYYLIIEGARLKGSGKGKYKGVKQIAFLHSLAVQKLEAYKKELERKGYSITDDTPIFLAYRHQCGIKDYSPFSVEGMFANACLNAWHDLEKKRFSPHDLRSFVQSALENAGVNPNIIAPILGHKAKGVDQHYSDHDVEDFREKFRTALPYLLPESVEHLKSEVERTKIRYEQQLESQQSEIKQLAQQQHKIIVWAIKQGISLESDDKEET